MHDFNPTNQLVYWMLLGWLEFFLTGEAREIPKVNYDSRAYKEATAHNPNYQDKSV